MYDIPKKILYDIRNIGERMSIDRIILFGSRARGTNHQRSDIDLAFCARNSREYFEVKDSLEEIDTLLMFDLVDMNSDILSSDLSDEIKKYGVVIYEKV